ncbi:MAG: HAD-IB family phosphatase [Cytophagales bacterium]|nr:HAD-IB family phosphatase [Cytophagales bacterium]MDW8384561.1 HAD-IB family phosphatase [Flammeovirgaceae bacterium]
MTYYVIDFDSTFTKTEALDELAKIVQGKEGTEIAEKIKRITEMAMEGKIGFGEALEERIKILGAHKKHLLPLIELLRSLVSDSLVQQKEFIRQNAHRIIIISGGFKDFILPVVTEYGILPENVYANTFLYDEEGNIIGVDKTNPLSQTKGKVKLIEQLRLKGKVCVVGDGYTDYEIKEAGLADIFCAFTENVIRPQVVAKADIVADSFEKVFQLCE